LPDGPVLAISATLKEAVTHHAVAEQKKDDSQENYNQELPGSK